MKYKVGDRVKVIACKHVYGHDNQKEATVTETFSDGRIHRVEYDNGKSWSHDQRCYGPLVAPTLENMPENTIVEKENGSRRKVLFALKPKLYVMKNTSTHIPRDIYITTAKSLKNAGFKIQKEIEELTTEEVCKELGRKVKIKD